MVAVTSSAVIPVLQIYEHMIYEIRKIYGIEDCHLYITTIILLYVDGDECTSLFSMYILCYYCGIIVVLLWYCCSIIIVVLLLCYLLIIKQWSMAMIYRTSCDIITSRHRDKTSCTQCYLLLAIPTGDQATSQPSQLSTAPK